MRVLLDTLSAVGSITGIGCYTSQLPLLFPDAPMIAAVRSYGNLVAGGAGVAERFWWL